MQMLKLSVDYMEFGYKASKEIFNEEDFGKWKFCNDADIEKNCRRQQDSS